MESRTRTEVTVSGNGRSTVSEDRHRDEVECGQLVLHKVPATFSIAFGFGSILE